MAIDKVGTKRMPPTFHSHGGGRPALLAASRHGVVPGHTSNSRKGTWNPAQPHIFISPSKSVSATGRISAASTGR